MTLVEPDVNLEIGTYTEQANQTFLQILGAGSNPAQMPTRDWATIATIINAAWPGFIQPTTYNQQTVSQLIAEILSHISGETQGLYYSLLSVAQQVDADTAGLNNVASAISVIQGGITQGGSPSELLASLSQTKVDLAGLHAWINTILLPRVGAIGYQGNATANDLSGLHAWINTILLPQVANLRASVNALHAVTTTALQQQANSNTGAITNLQSQVSTVIEPQIAQQSGALNKEIAQRQQDTHTLQGLITNAVTGLTGYASGAASAAENGAITKVMTQVQPQLDKIATQFKTCVDTLCENVSPSAKQVGKVGSLLQGLEKAGIIALLMALCIQAIEDPKAAADEIVTATGWITTLALDMTTVVGVTVG